MIIKWREQTAGGVVEHEFDWAGSPRTREMRWIKERTEFKNTIAFLEALEQMDPDAITALIIILSARQNRVLKWDDVDVDPMNELDFVMNDEEQARANLVKTINEVMSTDPGKEIKPSENSSQDLISGTSNGLLSAVASKPNAGTTLPNSGDGTG